MLIVQVCDFGEDGDAFYRIHSPSRFLAHIDGVTAIDVHFYHRDLHRLLEIADVVVLQFVDDWELLSLCERRRAAGKITIFEANDYFFDIQPWNPIARRWHDREVQELYRYLLRCADGVQTSTHTLAGMWREMGAPRVAVFENHLVDVAPLPVEQERPFTVGWAGSPGHFADWFSVVPHLTRWLSQNPDTRLAVMTNDVARDFFTLPPERYSFQPFGSLQSYLMFLRSLDVGIAPLLPSDYNRGRSDVKYLEYASQGVVGIYWDLDPYQRSVRDGGTGFLVRTPEEAMERLDRLKSDADLRRRIRKEAYRQVTTERLLQERITERYEWYRSLLEKAQPAGAPESSELPAEIRNTAVCEGRYLQLRPGEIEREFIQALQVTDKPVAVQRLSSLAQRHPHYGPVLHALGVACNNVRDTTGAATALQALARIQPSSLKGAVELGRTLFLAGRQHDAHRAVAQVVHEHPSYLPGWKYLLKLLSICGIPATDKPHQVEELFPNCYTVSLLLAEIGGLRERLAAVTAVLKGLQGRVSRDERMDVLSVCRGAVMSLLTLARKELARGDLQGGSVERHELFELLNGLLEQCVTLFPESSVLRGESARVQYERAIWRLANGDPEGPALVKQAYAQYSVALSLGDGERGDRDDPAEGPTKADPMRFAEYILRFS